MKPILVSLLLTATIGCVTTQTTPLCRHTALMCASVMSEHSSRTFIAVGPSLASTQYHAQVLSDGKWISYKNGSCVVGSRDSFHVTSMYTIEDFVATYWRGR
jgi:hypothetical protein